MSCNTCRDGYKHYGQDPECLIAHCPTGFDVLPDAALRWLQLRGMLVYLADLGLSGQIAREYDITREDMEMLAWIEAELQELRPKEPGHGGH